MLDDIPFSRMPMSTAEKSGYVHMPGVKKVPHQNMFWKTQTYVVDDDFLYAIRVIYGIYIQHLHCIPVLQRVLA